MPCLVVRESVRSFGANRGLQAAAALACYGFLALMPLLLLLMSILGQFMRSSDAVLDAMRVLTRDLFPSFNETILNDLMALSRDKVWGVISIVALAWSVTPFSGAVREAIRQAFKSERKMHVTLAKVLDLSAVLGLLGLLVFLVLVRVYFVAAGDVPILGRMFQWALPPVMTALVISAFYAVFAPVRLRSLELLAGALTAAVLLSIIRPLFAAVLAHHPSYGYAFGSLKTLFLLIVWVHYTFAVLLFGAEVMANARRRESLLLRGLFVATGRTAKPPASALMERFVLRLAPGEVLFRQGEDGHDMFAVRSGAIRLTVDGREVRTMRAGEYLGEMSMLLNTPRTATATAEGETDLVTISSANFEILLRENPRVVTTLLKEMAERLKTTTDRLARGV